MQNKINLIMFNMSTHSDWQQGIVNRNYNILNALAKEAQIEKIVAVDFLPVGFKNTVKHYFRNIFWQPKHGEMIYGDLTTCCYQKTDKIFVYSSIDSFFSYKTVARELRRIEKILNLKNIVFWSYNPMFVEFIGKLNEQLFVFDTVDDWTNHPNFVSQMKKERLVKNYKTISQKADIIFTVSEELKNFYQKMGREKDVYWIPNGVDFDHFNDPQKTQTENKLALIENKIIGYVGTIEDRIDLDLVAKIAKDHSDKEVIMLGPIWPRIENEYKKKLGHLKNVHSFGRIKWEDTPSYMNRFDVAIIPYKQNDFVKSTNSMKMYDYLACGKPVVATNQSGATMFPEQLYIADNKKDFSNLINKALNEDSSEKQNSRRAAVKKHSWQARVDQMTEIIYEKLK